MEFIRVDLSSDPEGEGAIPAAEAAGYVLQAATDCVTPRRKS